MENLWIKAHQFILDSKLGDRYSTGGEIISVIKRTRLRIHFSNGDLVTIKKSKYGFYHLVGKRVDQILRDIEGYFIFLKHDYSIL